MSALLLLLRFDVPKVLGGVKLEGRVGSPNSKPGYGELGSVEVG